ncbi:cell division protein FtsH [Chondrus crispus]|uniref:Cell division protein FtsH n=1 Tax=Chondrus crispus TaxID=2769 RepID=R7Q4T2_CHOCR|nr:cell division protein FtsH [Chondrus crispus]CDF33542.1 cell division protein FtsH [Chondrus crispus]|eukprot:XP_005713345.1 cell division protein FtsH [Chondrus crispus]
MAPMAFVSHAGLPLRRLRATRSVTPTMSATRPRSLPAILLDPTPATPKLHQVSALLSAEAKRAASYAAAAAVLASVAASSAVPANAAADPVQMTGARQETSASMSRSLGGDSATPAPASNGVQDWRYSEFINAVEKDQVEKVTFSADGQRLLAVDTEGNRFKLDALPNDPDLLKTLTGHKVDVTVLPSQPESGAGDFIRSLIFPALLFGGLFLLSRRAGGGSGGGFGGMGGPMDLQRSGARVAMVPETGITFQDVAGVDGAKLELQEVVQFLKESERFTELGARIPRGVILEGPPGTGKTLLARAVAGEAGVPFFSISGSEFVEMFVGVGASRVRDLFANAKKNAPCIIFIDEIDAVGRQRGAGIAGGNDEREQTLNQMLTEMDGFEGNSGVIVIAATNRADVLDQALLRPGRFDRRIIVDLPDFSGRLAILKVHARGKPLAKDVDLEQISRRTPGFSGASLQNLLNEAAIFTARRKKTEIGPDEVSDAIDRITVGAEKKDAVMTPRRQKLVAYHEAGHAVVGALTPDYDQVAKISIIPRGGAGGLTFFAPNEQRVDSGLYSRQFLEGQLAVALGGRIAEEIIYGDDEVTTGASNDLQRVTQVAKQMVTRFGMSEKVGQLVVSSEGSNPFLGRQMASGSPQLSSVMRTDIDDEVRRLVNVAYTRAKSLLTNNRPLLDALAEMLIEKETVSAEEFQRLIAENKIEMMPYSVY